MFILKLQTPFLGLAQPVPTQMPHASFHDPIFGLSVLFLTNQEGASTFVMISNFSHYHDIKRLTRAISIHPTPDERVAHIT